MFAPSPTDLFTVWRAFSSDAQNNQMFLFVLFSKVTNRFLTPTLAKPALTAWPKNPVGGMMEPSAPCGVGGGDHRLQTACEQSLPRRSHGQRHTRTAAPTPYKNPICGPKKKAISRAFLARVPRDLSQGIFLGHKLDSCTVLELLSGCVAVHGFDEGATVRTRSGVGGPPPLPRKGRSVPSCHQQGFLAMQSKQAWCLFCFCCCHQD